VERNEGVGP
jgi:hypothetical protein